MHTSDYWQDTWLIFEKYSNITSPAQNSRKLHRYTYTQCVPVV